MYCLYYNRKDVPNYFMPAAEMRIKMRELQDMLRDSKSKVIYYKVVYKT